MNLPVRAPDSQDAILFCLASLAAATQFTSARSSQLPFASNGKSNAKFGIR
jgi:hypothetical protein